MVNLTGIKDHFKFIKKNKFALVKPSNVLFTPSMYSFLKSLGKKKFLISQINDYYLKLYKFFKRNIYLKHILKMQQFFHETRPAIMFLVQFQNMVSIDKI